MTKKLLSIFEKNKPKDKNEIIRYLRAILSCSSTVLGSVNDLTDSLSITNNGFKKKEEQFKVHPLLLDVLSTNFFRSKKTKIKLKLDSFENVPLTLIGDKMRIT